MKELNFKWTDNTAQYATGEILTINGIQFAFYGWNSARSRDDKDAKDWYGRINLPGLSNTLYDNDRDTIKHRIEAGITAWFKKILGES